MRRRLSLIGGIAALALGIGALVVLDQRHGTLRDEIVPDTIGWFLVAWIGWVVITLALEGREARPRLRWLISLGLALRLALVFTEPTLSDDVYRYLWEGHLVTEGVSPYEFAPSSPEAERYDIAIRAQVNNNTLASPYLPVAHGTFATAAAVLPSEPWAMQVTMVGFDVISLVFLLGLLRLTGIAEHRAMLYWLNPLVIVEVAHGAHIDAMIVGLGLAGVYFTLRDGNSRQGRLLGPVLISVSTLTRPLAALFAPVLWWRWTWPQRLGWGATLAVPVLVAGAFVGFGLDSNGTGVIGSTRSYAETFRFNSAIYQAVEKWVSSQGLDDRGWNEPGALTRLLIAAATAAILVTVFVRARHAADPRATLRWLTVPVVTYVLLTPVLHPWYVLLLLALVPFLTPAPDEDPRRWIDAAPWLLLSGLLVFSYLTYEDPNAFAERTWVRRLQWWPTLGVAAVAAVRQVLGRRHRTGDHNSPQTPVIMSP